MTDPVLVDTKALRFFLAVAETCSISKAAKRLGVTQSAVSQSMRGLEDYFGTDLINHHRRPLTLTPAGLMLRNRGSVQIEELLSLRGSVLDAARGIKPDLRMGLIDSFAATCGMYLTRDLIGKVAQLELRSGSDPPLSEALVNRGLDLLISSDPLEDVDGIVRTRLMQERFLVIVPRSARVEVHAMEDLIPLAETLPIVRFNLKSRSGMLIERILRRCRIKCSRYLEVDNPCTLTAMVAGGVGWAFITPLCLLQGSQFARSVRTILLSTPVVSRSIYVVAREREFDQLIEPIVTMTLLILRDRVLPKLRSIDDQLVKLVQLESG
jgi:DNA-binding transcriptional LysR family regulator